MPDLGKYTDTVVLAYLVSTVLLGGLVALTWLQNRQAKRLLDLHEADRDK